MYKINDVDTVLFDLDGTLTDSGPGVMNASAYAIEKFGLPPVPRAELAYFVGPPLREAFAERLGVSAADAERLITLFREYYVEKGVYENSLYDGVPEMLSRIGESGRRLMICSMKPQHLADKVTRYFGIDTYFERIAAADLSGRFSEKNAIIERLMDECAVRKAVLVGDRRFDVEAARHASVLSLAVTWGYAEEGELAAAAPDYIADTPEQTAELICKGGNALAE